MSDPRFTKRIRIGRLRLGLTVYTHRGHLPDRWVFQSSLIYDRKPGSR